MSELELSDQSPPRILIVEDDPNILLSLVFVFERAGYRVKSVSSGRDALGLMRAEPPDLVVLDLMLPDQSGYEVCHEARSDPRLRKLPIVMLTARAQEAERWKGLEVGATAYVTKPFRVADLVAQVAGLLSQERCASR